MNESVLEHAAPHHTAIDTERDVLGSALIDREAFLDAREILTENDFFLVKHSIIWRHLEKLNAANQPLDMTLLIQNLSDAKTLEEVGGVAYLAGLMGEWAISLNAKQYAQVVREKSQLRALELAGKKIVFAARDNTDVTDAVRVASDAFTAATSSTRQAVKTKSLMADCGEVYKRNQSRAKGDAVHGIIYTGISDFDKTLGGFEPGQLVVIAARPGMGKTVMGLQIAIHAGRKNQRGWFQSLEMNQSELVQRAVALRGGVDYNAIRFGKLSHAELEYISKLSELPIEIDDRAGLTVDDIVLAIQRAHRSEPLQYVVIDHLHRISRRANSKNNGTEEIGYMASSLKNLAKQLNIPILLLAQLSRANEGRPDKRPNLGDLRGSGDIEQEADIVIFPYRQSYYTKDATDHTAEWIIEKCRAGQLGAVDVAWQGKYQRFTGLSHDTR